ncbi:hypothetical protein KIN20_022156 [Parelaphostrongylus tenuis]|uniref:Uncharacterized protein n=1 Tax=Parelaphostrongylus tenuis TaxID=148309 RepID=A0AAD5MK56_PARTN|nr:hypothetical protein KIN20_004580 [Parelaphostrongylus tenuis]KAJ1362560.1 hypothetical protein KIN20_022156 [Parelaphostrongylus tenuis]
MDGHEHGKKVEKQDRNKELFLKYMITTSIKIYSDYILNQPANNFLPEIPLLMHFLGRLIFTGSQRLNKVSTRFSLEHLSSTEVVCFEHDEVHEAHSVIIYSLSLAQADDDVGQ